MRRRRGRRRRGEGSWDMRGVCADRGGGWGGYFVRFVGIGEGIGVGSVGRGIVGWSVRACIRIRGVRSFMRKREVGAFEGVFFWGG